MNEGTLKTPTPKCRLYWSFLLFTLSVYTVHLVWEEGEGEDVREKVEGQQYTSIIPSSMGATVHKLRRKYHS
jgi:hypothetical protein